MKRVCTKSEKLLLYKNRKQMLEGIYQTSSKSRLSQTFIELFLSVIAIFAWIFGNSYFFHTPVLVSVIGMFICFTASRSIVSMVLNNWRIKKAKKSFLRKETLMINGATLIRIEDNGQFLYIEDDFLDDNGKPIILEYPSRLLEISQEDLGKRFLIVYDEDCNFQLVRLNDELNGMIPDSSPFYPLADKLNEYSSLSHPNMKNIERDGQKLSEQEKEKFADLYVNTVQNMISKFIKIMNILIAVLFAIFSALLYVEEDGVPLGKTLLIGVFMIIGLNLILLISKVVGKGTLRRQGMQFTHVKKVVFHSYVIDATEFSIKVYEWYNGQVRLRKYPAGNSVAANTAYGSVLYMLIKSDGTCALLNTSPTETQGNQPTEASFS
ncbi:MAG: hypothetical protein NC412_00250 [Roseburia sp.]|nr:hypothetical protein [Roseburia sp.]MCM1277812.1 hypothetical protein [Robinsoniella sp.]